MGPRFCSLIFAALLVSGVSSAAGDDSDPSDQAGAADPAIAAFERAKAQNDWPQAAAVMRDALKRAPENANYHNRYAFALRKSPNPNMDLVFKHYGEALRLKPEHRGAHEYIGEAYLMVSNLPKAKEHLAALDGICLFGCEEYDDLKEAVEAYEERGQTPVDKSK